MGPSAPVQETLHQSVCQLRVRRLDIFFSSIHGTFSMIDHTLGHETSLNKVMTEIISSIFYFLPYHNGMILEINNSNKTGKFTNIWNLNTFLNNQWNNEEIKREIKIYWNNGNRNTTYQSLQNATKAFLREKVIARNT